MVNSSLSGDELTYIFSDHLGSASITANANGTLLSRTLYYPWGEVRYQTGALPTDYTYTGQYSYTCQVKRKCYRRVSNRQKKMLPELMGVSSVAQALAFWMDETSAVAAVGVVGNGGQPGAERMVVPVFHNPKVCRTSSL